MVYWLSKDIVLPCPLTSTLPARQRERERVTEPVAKLICLSGTVSIVLFVLFFFQAVAYKKG